MRFYLIIWTIIEIVIYIENKKIYAFVASNYNIFIEIFTFMCYT